MPTYRIHPSIGVARVGDHPSAFFLAPDSIGGLPIECDQTTGDDEVTPFTKFKANGQIKRQGQKFRIYDVDVDEDNPINLEELRLAGDIQSYEWKVHLVNQKSSWYEYAELKGNLLLGPDNSYDKWIASGGIGIRNNIQNKTIGDTYRHKFLLDPGPISVNTANSGLIPVDEHFDNGYPSKNFPHKDDVDDDENGYENFSQAGYGTDIEKLGDIKTDTQGNLIVLGGHGNSWGHTPLAGYGGGDTWFDDVSDGYVTCTITPKVGEPITLKAWVIVGPPDFAPELSNISSWDDTSFDVAVRNGQVSSDLYTPGLTFGTGSFNTNFYPDYERDIKPIINRIAGYHWVANVQAMLGFSAELDSFSALPGEEQNLDLRRKYFSYFREPEPPMPDQFGNSRQYEMFSGTSSGPEKYDGIPKMPLNSGSNSVRNTNIEKFLALTPTQYFFLQQWSEGNVSVEGDSNWFDIYANFDEKDRASIGNVVGLPQCPGIEVTWPTQNPAIYDYNSGNGFHHINYDLDALASGITVGVDECAVNTCQPGDLTKRMAIPWQADYYNCSIQMVNYTEQDVNKYIPPSETDCVPKPPTYYAYWWPPQAPWDVISEQLTTAEQETSLGSEMAGLQVSYARGMNGYSQMVNGGWAALGFIRNRNTDPNYAKAFPYFTETERDYDLFSYREVPYKDITLSEDGHDITLPNPNDEEGSFVITSFNIQPALTKKRERLQGLLKALDEAEQNQESTFLMANAAKAMPISHHRAGLQKSLETIDNFTQIPVRRRPNEVPRSGRRIRF